MRKCGDYVENERTPLHRFVPLFSVYLLSELISCHDRLEWGVWPAFHVSLDLGEVEDLLVQGEELGRLLLPLDTS